MKRGYYRKKKRRAAGKALAALLLGGILFFVCFRVKNIEVLENERYSEKEIKEMVLRGPLAYNSVLAPLFYSKGVEGIPFVRGFEVRQVGRDTISISVLEKQPVGCVPFLDCFLYFDRSGRIIESSTKRDTKIPFFDGADFKQVVLGDELELTDANLLDTAVSLARIFEKNDRIPDHIFFDDKGQAELEYGTIRVKLGGNGFLEDKMSRLLAILPKLTGERGILHMESVGANSKTITFEKEMAGDEQRPSETKNPSEAEDGVGAENPPEAEDGVGAEDLPEAEESDGAEILPEAEESGETEGSSEAEESDGAEVLPEAEESDGEEDLPEAEETGETTEGVYE